MTKSNPPKSSSTPNRPWIKPPNIIVKKGPKNSPQKLSYWTDTDNKVKLYTQQELAICNILMNVNQLLTQALTLIDVLKSLDDDAKVGDLIHQDYDKFKFSQQSVFNRFINLISAVPDVTFGEFLNFISTTNNPEQFKNTSQKIINQVTKGKSNQVTTFYTSDRFRKS